MEINESIKNRKGPRKVEDVSAEVLTLLNGGMLETVNLTEWLAIDHIALIEGISSELGIGKAEQGQITSELKLQKKPTSMSSTKVVGATLYRLFHAEPTFEALFQGLSNHTSDTVRGYAAYLIGLDESLSIEAKLLKAKPLVADHHFGVREVIWFAIRPAIDESLNTAIDFLSLWTEDKDENVRRFTTEATRPRGVWCKQIQALVQNPELALPILEKLKSDKTKYVQDSVGNWLNDASKSQPDFVIDLCERWQQESPTAETNKIIKKARRTIDKKK
ncbi:MAG: DNA alkylation repair protein [Cytophagales bacterium]|nr:DNA alkylation repair protein [Cytophagales bacterium]